MGGRMLLITVECWVLTSKCAGNAGDRRSSFATITVKTGSGKNRYWVLDCGKMVRGGHPHDFMCLSRHCLLLQAEHRVIPQEGIHAH